MYMQSAGDAECSSLSNRSFAGRSPSVKDSIGKDGFIKRSLSENAFLASYWFFVSTLKLWRPYAHQRCITYHAARSRESWKEQRAPTVNG